MYGPMHTIAADGEVVSSAGIVGLRVTTVHRFDATGAQFEGEFYPTITRTMYGYLDYGYSASGLFPRHRVGAEFYSRIGSHVEGSVGGRAFVFPGASSVLMGTATVTLYSGAFYLSLRPFFTSRDAEWATSGTLTIRYYTAGSEDYLSARLGSGYSADERWLQSSGGFSGRGVYFLASRFAGAGLIQTVGRDLALIAEASYTHQELGTALGSYAGVYSGSLGMRIRF
jgi:YaiO family outer membrane protein